MQSVEPPDVQVAQLLVQVPVNKLLQFGDPVVTENMNLNLDEQESHLFMSDTIQLLQGEGQFRLHTPPESGYFPIGHTGKHFFWLSSNLFPRGQELHEEGSLWNP